MRHMKKLLSLTAVMVLAACTDNGVLNPNDIEGTYQLTIWADNSIPITFNVQPGEDSEIPNGGTWRVTGGTLELDSDGTFVETNFITKTPTGGSSFTSNFVSTGTYSFDGFNIDFEAPAQNQFSARSFTGTVSADERIRYHEFDSASGQNLLYEYRR
ncbi:MAG: hypothetical protein ACJ78J_08935 [Gemmatimonadaceae bacterium]